MTKDKKTKHKCDKMQKYKTQMLHYSKSQNSNMT